MMICISLLCVLIYPVFPFTKMLHGKHQPLYDGQYHIQEATGFFNDSSLLKCLSRCLQDDKCLTFFYNNQSKQCILHSNPFYYTQMSESGEGWKLYIAKSGHNRCPYSNDFFFYRRLDICYNFNGVHVRDYNQIEDICNTVGASLLSINSDELQHYVTATTVDIELVARKPICIQGSQATVNSEWRYNNGVAMTYFNWGSGQPSGPGYIIMKRDSAYAWFVTTNSTSKSCTFICVK